MTSRLARQRDLLNTPSADGFLHHDQDRKKKMATLIFDPAEAANLDVKDLFAIGLAGLQVNIF